MASRNGPVTIYLGGEGKGENFRRDHSAGFLVELREDQSIGDYGKLTPNEGGGGVIRILQS